MVPKRHELIGRYIMTVSEKLEWNKKKQCDTVTIGRNKCARMKKSKKVKMRGKSTERETHYKWKKRAKTKWQNKKSQKLEKFSH